MNKMCLQINSDWHSLLSKEIQSDNFKLISDRIQIDRKRYDVFPVDEKIFHALNSTPFNKLKVVIIGQDPYHGKNQANGLAFSVTKGFKTPPSLRNIHNELMSDLEINNFNKTNLHAWAKQGVLLLNSTLTVIHKKPNSHRKIGWEKFTDSIIKKIVSKKKGIVFILWGKDAQKKINLINKKKHYILCASHPSPLSANKSFFGCKHFSITNSLLIKNKQKPINWRL